ncbi:MAG: Ku protein, partial [Xanthobacteraceae bacterium]
YYIAPDGKVGQDAFVVIRNIIESMKMVAIGRVVLTSREHIIAMEPRGKGIMGMLLRYPYEVRDEKENFDEIPDLKLGKDMMDLARHIVETKSGDFEPEKFEDHYESALKELIEKKSRGIKIEVPTERAPAKVVNLMDALRRSVAAETQRTAPTARPASAKKSRKRIEGQKEMLLPIPGKKGKELEAKPSARPSARQKKAG